MIFNTLEQILIKFSFIVFCLVTLFSWLKITIFSHNDQRQNIFMLEPKVRLGQAESVICNKVTQAHGATTEFASKSLDTTESRTGNFALEELGSLRELNSLPSLSQKGGVILAKDKVFKESVALVIRLFLLLFSNSYVSFIGIFLGFISVTGLCIIRWNFSDHLPLSNLYESSLFLSWSLICLYLIFKLKISPLIPLLSYKLFEENLGFNNKSFWESRWYCWFPYWVRKFFGKSWESRKQKPSLDFPKGNPQLIWIESEWLDAITAPIILIITTFSTLGLPKQLQEATALVPALQSNWLMMHVTMMILSYGALLFGSLLAVTLLTLTFPLIDKNDTSMFLWHKSYENKNDKNLIIKLSHVFYSLQNTKNSMKEGIEEKTAQSFAPMTEPIPEFAWGFSEYGFWDSSKKKISETKQETKTNSYPALTKNYAHSLNNTCSITNHEFFQVLYLQKYQAMLVNQIDYWSYRIIGIGFPLLTLGILSGAVWANEAWGSYWNWDPKETWALITWVVFAIYLHIRITKGWNGKKPALVALVGFFVVWMCYLGVNLLGQGLHSYGWLT